MLFTGLQQPETLDLFLFALDLLSKINQPTLALNKQRGLHLDLNFLDPFICYSCLCAGHSLLPQCQSQHVFLCYPPTISRSSHTGLRLEQTQANWLYPLLWSSEVWQTHRWGRISLSICMSRSHEASHGACLESTERGWGAVGWGGGVCAVRNGADWRGAGHCAFRQVGVGSGVNW